MAPITTEDFPAPRFTRTGGPAISTGGVTSGPTIPNTRVFAYQLSCAAGRRSTVMFGPLRAPWLIHSHQFSYTSAAVPIASGIELGVAVANQPENQVLTSTTRPYVPITEQQAQPPATFNENILGWFAESVGGMGKQLVHPVRKLVLTPDSFLAVAWQNDAAGGNGGGTVVVIEGISDEVAQSFL